MGDPRTSNECPLAHEIKRNETVIISPVEKNGPELEENRVEGFNQKVDLATRALNFCRRVPCMGITLAFVAGLFFAVANIVVKFVDKRNPLVIVIFGGLTQLIVFVPVIVYNRFSIFGAKGEGFPLFFRGFTGFVALITSYISYQRIPLSDATTIISAAVVFVSIVACVVLKEECGVFQAFTVVVTLCGVLLIARPTFIFGSDVNLQFSATSRMEGTIFAFACCITCAITYICIRKLQNTPSVVVIHSYAASCAIYSLITVLVIHFFFQEEAGKLGEGIAIPETWSEIGWLVLNGLSGVLAQICLTVSFKIEEAGLVSLVRTSDIIIAFVFQLLFLGNEKIMWTSFLGAVIVFSGVFVSGLRRWLKSKPGKFDTLWLILNCGQRRPTVA